MKPLNSSVPSTANGQERVAEVESSARLHFGFLDIHGSLGRFFGSIGLCIDTPRVRIRAVPAESPTVLGAHEDRIAAARKYAALFYEHPEILERLDGKLIPAAIHLEETIPPHQGLGSGTQLGLCVVSALAALHNIPCDTFDAARISRRGLRSGIGIHAFSGGGFIVDAGSTAPGTVPPLALMRCDFPKEWRMILVQPPPDALSPAGSLSGKAEEDVFSDMTPNTESAREVCHLALMRLLPGLLERDFVSFTDALARIQRITGEYFAKYQGGCFASRAAEDIFAQMSALGARGMGQSSWGPTLYGVAISEASAHDVARGLIRHFGSGLRAHVAAGRNDGATLKITGMPPVPLERRL